MNAPNVLECGGKRSATPLWEWTVTKPKRHRRCALPAQSKIWRKLAAFYLLTSALCLRTSAQFSIDWFTIDGGGGTSTDGAYTVSGTIGQPDAGKMSGGNFSLDGGFWGLIAAVQTPGSPLLSILRTTTNAVVVFWPLPSTGFVLQENPIVNTTNWTDVGTSPTTNGPNLQVVVPSPLGNRFYRLRHP